MSERHAIVEPVDGGAEDPSGSFDAMRREPAAAPIRSIVIETSEVRWFASGPLPEDVVAWFTGGGFRGVTEERTDVYRLDGRPDVGVKLRGGELLEVKERQAIGDAVDLGAGLVARFDEWRKSRPLEPSVWAAPGAVQVEVAKSIVARNFGVDGDEIADPVRDPNRLAAGCVVELATVRIGELEAWTLCFEAAGPERTRLHAVEHAWWEISTQRPPRDDLGSYFDHACAYPEWLATAVTMGRTTPPAI